MIDESQFAALAAQGYNRIPITLETFADLDTPLSIYLKLANAPYTYLLESVQGGERFGRYSIVGLSANTRIEVHGTTVLVFNGENVVERGTQVDPLAFIEQFMQKIKVPPTKAVLRFCGGLVGCLGYETVRYIEPKLANHNPADDLNLPDMIFLLSDEIAIVDNLSGKLTLVVYAEPNSPEAYKKACAHLHDLVKRLREPVVLPKEQPTASEAPVSAFGEAAFKDAVRRAKDYIVAGDIMQVVLSQRMSKSFKASPLSLYRALRTLNPSPYMFYFNFRDFNVVGASPEILVRVENAEPCRKLVLRPIAGTRKRGATSEEDLALESDLLQDEKERAEHLQLLDLGRNDLGRVAQIGTVRVTDQFIIERYSHVMHIVSNVEAELRPGLSSLDVLRATFPAGTVSGAPKVRAMEIIDELEPHKRGIYAGAVGYIGFDGAMDIAIAIRTAVIKDGNLYAQAGAGIVADSDPNAEWQETLNKAKAILRAAEMAEEGLDTRLP